MTREQGHAFLDDAALRALLVGSRVTPHRGGDDGPFELFLANGVYQRGSGWGIAFEGRFEVVGGTVCVEGEGAPRLCRRVLANDDGNWTFMDAHERTAAVMLVSDLSVDREIARLTGEEIRARLVGRSIVHDGERARRQRLSAILSPYREQFRADGTVVVTLDRGASMHGTYRIAGDQLCLSLNNGVNECRHLFRAREGGLLQQDATTPTGEMTAILIR